MRVSMIASVSVSRLGAAETEAEVEIGGETGGADRALVVRELPP